MKKKTLILIIVGIVGIVVFTYSIIIKVNACKIWVKDGAYKNVTQCWFVD